MTLCSPRNGCPKAFPLSREERSSGSLHRSHFPEYCYDWG